MNLIDKYVKTKNKIESIKEEIIDKITVGKLTNKSKNKPYIDLNGVVSKHISIINFKDLNNSWSSHDHTSTTNDEQIKAIAEEIRGSKDVYRTLNNIANHGNVTNRQRWYFTKLDEKYIKQIKNILGKNYFVIPKGSPKRNTSSYPSKK